MTEAVDKMISLLNLESKRNVQSSKLSGGMKRKLSVGIALIGNSEVTITTESKLLFFVVFYGHTSNFI